MLGLESDDIDIALDDMTGIEFAKIINETLYPGQVKYGSSKSDVEQSKHLEIGFIKVHGIHLDLVNLRSETYSEESRIPQ